jgi:ankyrin repeat protein
MALFEAVQNNDLNLVQELIQSGASPNEKDRNGWTPLHYASMNGYIEVVRELIRCGADVNEKNIYRQTPLHLASMRGMYMGVVRELIRCGADMNAKDNQCCTPLHYASNYGRIDIVKEFLFFGVDYTIQNLKGEDGLHDLTEEQHILVLEECCSMEVKEPSVD